MGKADVEQGNEQKREVPTFHCQEINHVANFFNTDVKNGISEADAAKRLEEDGPNKMSEGKKRTIWEMIWDQISNVLVVVLLIVAVISAVKGGIASNSEDAVTNWIEVALILGVIVLNTIIGIRQEGSAQKSADALKDMLPSKAQVIRDGKKIEINGEDLVKGDIVALSLGDKIPADIRLTKVSNFACAEAALTGESLPIEKVVDSIAADKPESVPVGDRKNLAFSATNVVQGSAEGIVILTGDDTEIGTINTIMNAQKKVKTNVEKQIDTISKVIAAWVILVAVVTILVARFLTKQEPLDAVTSGLVAAVAMIPEGLAAIVTLTYAYAVSNMSKQKAIVRALPAVETLGSVTVICSDKTGTLTQNVMSMVAFVVSDGRFRIDVNSTQRTANNFTRDNNYMAYKRGEANPSGLKGEKAEIPQSSFIDEKSIDTKINPASGNSINASGSKGESPSSSLISSMLSTGILCSKCELPEDGGRNGAIGNPTEISIMRAAFFAGTDHTQLRTNQPIVAEVPFSSEWKFMATVHKADPTIDGPDSDGKLTVHVKGAIDRILPLCNSQCVGGVVTNTEPVNRSYWETAAEQLSSHGFRVLCLTRATIPDGSVEDGQALKRDFVDGADKGKWLTIVGLAAIQDPPRAECVDAIKVAHGAKVRVAMITGDHKATALAIGEELGIVNKDYPDAVTGTELDEMDFQELRVAVMSHNVFARASPENKIRIVEALKREGQVCSMTGDGVNDAPALKAANMGVAMGLEGTDVAREASDMILADDNFATIVAAVKEGRVVWDNLRKILLFNTPVNNAQGLTVTFGLIASLPYSPLTPIQVLYCNMICAVTLGFVLAIEPAEDGIMNNPPRRPGKRLVGRYLLFRIAFATCILVAFTVGSVFWVHNWGIDENLPKYDSSFCMSNFGNNGIEDDGGVYSCCAINSKCKPDVLEAGNPQNCLLNLSSLSPGNSILEHVSQVTPEVDPSGDHVCPNTRGRELVRSQASNTLTFSAISIMLSARFSYNSAIHPRIFTGNKAAWVSVFITASLQVLITYVPGLNNIVFQMGPMIASQWGICMLFVFLTFILMEIEKAFMRFLKSRKHDTDDNFSGPEDVKDNDMTEPLVTTASQRSAALHQQLLKR